MSRRAENCGSGRTKSELYLDREGFFNTQMIEFLNKSLSIEQLKELKRRSRGGGKDSVDSSGGQPGDEANVISGVTAHLAISEPDWPLSKIGISMGKIEPAEPNMDKPMTDKEIRDFLYTSEERKRSHEDGKDCGLAYYAFNR